jgi:hypothetical protein
VLATPKFNLDLIVYCVTQSFKSYIQIEIVIEDEIFSFSRSGPKSGNKVFPGALEIHQDSKIANIHF